VLRYWRPGGLQARRGRPLTRLLGAGLGPLLQVWADVRVSGDPCWRRVCQWKKGDKRRVEEIDTEDVREGEK
jgi:hypothetical protein